MGPWMYVLWAVVGLMVAGGLLKIMLVRRNEVVVDWQKKINEEKKKNASKTT